MLINANTNEGDIKTKICIIGSGIGGGSLVKKLAEQKKIFVVIEAGGLKGNSKKVQFENTGLDFGVRTTRSIQLGGTSNLWHGVLSPLDKIDFEKRDWIPHSGWPVSLADLQPFYRQAAEILRVREFDYFDEQKLAPELKEKLQDITFNEDYLRNKLFQQPLPSVNFKDIVLQTVEKSAERHCYYHAVALELIADAAGVRIEKLLVGSSGGKNFYVEADLFIVAAGALETPRLLLNSNKVIKEGLGNKGANVGRFLSDHPMANLCQVQFLSPQKAPIYSDTKYRPDMKIKTGLELHEKYQREMRLPNHNFFLRPSFIKGIDDQTEKLKLSLLSFKDGGVTAKDVWSVLTHLNVIRQILAYKLSLNVTFKYADLFFLTEQMPNPQSRVSLSTIKDDFGYPIARVDWQITAEDINSVKIWFQLLMEKFFPKQHFKFTHTLNDFNWETVFTSAIHHVGSARMAKNVSEGVVDNNLKVFGVDNLYICDGSVFTTAGNVNNSFTISALACRLTGHLCEK